MSAPRMKEPTNVDLVNALVELAGDYAQKCRCLDPRCHHYRVLCPGAPRRTEEIREPSKQESAR